MPSKPSILAAVGIAGAALVLAACSNGRQTPSASSSSAGGGGTSGAITIEYIQKQGTQQYFVDEANGAKAEAQQLGNVTVKVVDVESDSNAAINAINTAIAQKVSAIALVAPDQKIGPQAIQLAQQAGIPLIASDDPLQAGDGSAAPFVGFDSTQMGQSVGQEAGQLYQQSGWTSANTRIINVEKQDLSDCVDRGKGALAAFQQVVGSDIPKVIDEGTDATTPDALNRTGAIITANPGVKNWVVWGCNDESETGAVTALANAGFGANNVIGVGLGAYLDCKDWQAGKSTGNKAALYIGGKDVGATAVKALVAKVRNGTALPAKSIAPTSMVTPTNWQQSGMTCS